MKIKKSRLKEIIKEELKNQMNEMSSEETYELVKKLKTSLAKNKNMKPDKRKEIEKAVKHLETLLTYV